MKEKVKVVLKGFGFTKEGMKGVDADFDKIFSKQRENAFSCVAYMLIYQEIEFIINTHTDYFKKEISKTKKDFLKKTNLCCQELINSLDEIAHSEIKNRLGWDLLVEMGFCTKEVIDKFKKDKYRNKMSHGMINGGLRASISKGISVDDLCAISELHRDVMRSCYSNYARFFNETVNKTISIGMFIRPFLCTKKYERVYDILEANEEIEIDV